MTVQTLLPIYTFAKRLGLHPLHFMGVDANIGTAQSRVCIHPISQFSWQDSDGVSREELSQAIFEAEDDIANVLGYWPAPKWTPDERVELIERPGYWFSSGYDIRGDRISCKAERGQMISGGRVVKTVVSAGAAIVYTDTDSDTYFETATIGPIATTVTDPEEIALYYPGLNGDDEWEIRPISATITGGTVTIVCRREQLVLKALLESLDPATAIGGLTNGNFLTTADVYRRYNDPSVQVEFQWRSSDWVGGCSSCGDIGCVSCGLNVQPGCMTVKDKKLGIVTLSPGDWNATNQDFDTAIFDVCRRPDNVRLWYRSGYRDMSLSKPNTSMAREWEVAIAKLAIARLDRNICSCKTVADVQAHWNTDLRRSTGTANYKVTNYELENNPFGSSVAAMDVWRLVRRRSLGI